MLVALLVQWPCIHSIMYHYKVNYVSVVRGFACFLCTLLAPSLLAGKWQTALAHFLSSVATVTRNIISHFPYLEARLLLMMLMLTSKELQLRLNAY